MNLIDRDKLIKEIRENGELMIFSDASQRERDEEKREYAINMLSDAPLVDPSRHGHWIIHNAEDIFEIFWECSVCGERQSISSRLKHCYECGSIMEEKKKYAID